MKGDFSRSTFRAGRHFASVRQQQGRVQIDADGNEAQDIIGHRQDATTRDVIGAAGAPIDHAGFGLTASGTTLTLTPGRLYVEGTLVENEGAVALPAQPHLAGGWALLPDGPASFDVATPAAGEYAVVLDVWPRHVTALEQPELIEPALNGVDTTTRVQTVWQAKLVPVTNGTSCADVPTGAAWKRHMTPSTGRMVAGTVIPPPSPDACDLSPSGGYQGLENQLYRVEIHESGGAGGATAATFKWSTDNASVATVATAWDNARSVSLASMGRDFATGWKIGDTVELLAAERELRGLPGTLLTITAIDGSALTLSAPHGLGAAASGDAAAAQCVRVRRWAGAAQKVPATGNALKLGEDGVVVTFDKAATAAYRTGDYWTIPARTALAAVEWPGGYQPCEGIPHKFALIGRIAVDAAGAITVLADCRDLFPPLGAMLDFGYAGGDGQQAEPRETGNATAIPLAWPLEVSVTRGKLPVAGMAVRFTIVAGPQGSLDMPPGTATRTVQTGADGLASCPWALDATFGDAPQRAVAALLDDGGQPIATPIHFSARVLGLLEMRLNGGDTQTLLREASDAGPFALPAPLTVAVLRAGRPAKGQHVRFDVTGGGGTLDGGAATLDVTTDDQGLASCHWTLASADPGAAVRALLMKDAGTPWGLPAVTFTATVLTETPSAATGGGCDVTIGKGGQFPTINDAIKALREDDARAICLCLLPGTHEVGETIDIEPDKGLALSIHGCGPATYVRFRDSSLVATGINAFEMRDLTAVMDSGYMAFEQIGSVALRRVAVDFEQEKSLLDISRVDEVTIEGCRFRKDERQPVVAIDSFGGLRRIVDSEVVGLVSFAGGKADSVDNLFPSLQEAAKAADRSGEEPAEPPAGNVLTITGNRISTVAIGPKLAAAMIRNSKLMPAVARVEGNILSYPGTMIAGMAIIFQANSFLSPGSNLLIGGMRTNDTRPNIKIIVNTGPLRTVIMRLGYAEAAFNAPIQIA